MRARFIVILIAACVQVLPAQPLIVERIEPPNWWVGMEWDTVQLVIEGRGLESATVSSNSPGVSVIRTHSSGNSRYTFVDVAIAEDAKPGAVRFSLRRGEESTSFPYHLLPRDTSASRCQGFSPADVIYLITPDRFANGDVGNDNVEGMREGLDRENHYGRHGGDLQGVIDHLDYLSDLGVTALWLNPLVENNGEFSYHGYAVTDMYRIDPRFGTNELYARLVEEAHKRGLKIIIDHVSNHIGINHRWMRSLPHPDWLNGSPDNHLPASHEKTALTDSHRDDSVAIRVRNGWFAPYMPDLNQRNPFVAKYLIQNTIWWIESTGLDGIREDTYPYIGPEFASEWAHAVRREYPRLTIVGEVWIQDAAYLPPYQEGGAIDGMPDTYMQSVTDFGLFDAMGKMFWDNLSISHVYHCLTKDFHYPNPDYLMTFLDNHDVQRIARVLKGDTERIKFALGLLLTLRGIPQIYYGTEIAMAQGPDHGRSRADFPGGFPGDERSAFVKAGRTEIEEEVFTYLQTMLKLRKRHKALQTGRFVHYPPKDEVYCYFRFTDDETMLVVANNSPQPADVDIRRFKHLLGKGEGIRNLMTGKFIRVDDDMIRAVLAQSVSLYEIVVVGR